MHKLVRFKLSTLFTLAFLLTSCTHKKVESEVITRDTLIEMFDSMTTKSSWDFKQPMLWGYFFTDASKEQLESVAPLLQTKGYKIVDIYLSDKDDESEPDLWWLHAEVVEIHSVDTLDRRNQELYKFADSQGIEYDGMDVGPAPKHQ